MQFHLQEREQKLVGYNRKMSDKQFFFTILKILVRVPLPSPALAFLALADCDFWSPWQRQKKSQCVKRVLEVFERGLRCGWPFNREPHIHFQFSWARMKHLESKERREYNTWELLLQGGLGSEGSVCSTKTQISEKTGYRLRRKSNFALLLQNNCSIPGKIFIQVFCMNYAWVRKSTKQQSLIWKRKVIFHAYFVKYFEPPMGKKGSLLNFFVQQLTYKKKPCTGLTDTSKYDSKCKKQC